jgi:hypothetical protein
MRSSDLKSKVWWSYLEEDLQELIITAIRLIEEVSDWEDGFHDYAFIVFPAAKAYEGFLKKLFLDLNLIEKSDYYGKQFRVGKSLNPSLPKRLQDADYVYDDLVAFCKGDDLAKRLWKTWRNCRNQLFHWFPDEKKAISFEEAKKKVEMVVESIDAAFVGCKIEMK